MLKKISAALTIVFLSSVTFSAVGESDLRNAVITNLKNEVQIKYGSSLWRDANLNQLIRPGTTIRTGALAKAEFKYPDGTIARMGGRTNMVILDKSIRAVKIASGKLWFKVAKRSAGYRIYSPTAVAAITGTEGFVEFGDTEKETSDINNTNSKYNAGLVEGSMDVFKSVDINDNPVGTPTQVTEGQVLSLIGSNFQLQTVGTDQIFNQYRDISTSDPVSNNTGNVQNQKLDPTNPTIEQVPNIINKQQDLNTSPTTGDLEIIIK